MSKINMSKSNIVTSIRNFETVGIRLVTYKDRSKLSRIDLFELKDPTEVLFEGYYEHTTNAVAKFKELTNETEAIDWAYRNS